ncbi:helix-turn-helix domain-containing protein [Saliphagus infecundisoli]|uniref:Helix-turn-helix domain-containing protein n=1 Tax=Saliphagus infecundisoli TaxID=1849069 RepID=A0ABD5QF55_9EURY|nr:helix-turn-helix domain-containing protein [Saliphagus infecundisoli]
MNHVRLSLDAGGREAEIHPMYDVLVNDPAVEHATATHWSFAGDELGIMHYLEGDREAFRQRLETIPEVREFEITPAGEAFYAYVRDATTEPLRELFGAVAESTAVVIPPIEYAEETVSYSVFGPGEEIEAAIERVPDPIEVRVEAVGGMRGVTELADSLVTDRQREALEVALAVGYYEVPREASHEDVAAELGCAPSTAAEHLRKGEGAVLQAVLGG